MKTLNEKALSPLSTWAQHMPADLWSTLPIDLDRVGAHWGVKKIIERRLDAAGLLYRLDKGGSVVFVKQGDSKGRQRFSCAHELGHIVMADERSPQFACRKPSQTNRALERCCDIIATEILMPRKLFCATADSQGWSLNAVRPLAERFCVSITAAAIRLLEFMEEPVLMTSWRVEESPLVRLKRRWASRNQAAKSMRPEVRWRTGPEALLPLYQSINRSGVVGGTSKVLMHIDRESRYSPVQTEALGVGRGDERTVLGFHYLSRPVGVTGIRNKQ